MRCKCGSEWMVVCPHCHEYAPPNPWVSIEHQEPPVGEDVLVLKTYLDAEYGERGYHPDKSFWTGPSIQIDTYWSDKRWHNGGKGTHWMKLPELPANEQVESTMQ